jgi:putative salt-induced outer membrane protein YdiY
MTHTRTVITALTLGCLLHGASASAQPAPAPPPPPAPPPAPAPPPPDTWTGTAGAGVSITSGNADTVTYNVAFDLTRDPKTRSLQKMKGLFIRGEREGELIANQLALAFRHQHTLTPRLYVFGQLDYLRDTFKRIDYLVAPTAGVGYKVVDTERTKFSVDAGAGVVWEKNTDLDTDASAAITAGEKLEHQLTDTTTLRHAATALWKADDFADGLYTVSVGVGFRISERLQFTMDLVDTFKNKPPDAATEKNDVVFVTALAAKF